MVCGDKYGATMDQGMVQSALKRRAPMFFIDSGKAQNVLIKAVRSKRTCGQPLATLTALPQVKNGKLIPLHAMPCAAERAYPLSMFTRLERIYDLLAVRQRRDREHALRPQPQRRAWV